MKRFVVFLMVVVLLAAMVSPALAAGGLARPAAPKGNFNLSGTITALGDTVPTVTVLVRSGNRVVKDYIGQELTLQTTETTSFLLQTAGGVIPITFDELEVGQTVTAKGKLTSDVWDTERIMVKTAPPSQQ